MNKGFAIAIDGPVASGKGTLAPNLAKRLDGFFLDTGAMYRCVALYALENNIDSNDQEAIEEIAKEIEIVFSDGKTFINGEEVSDRIRSVEISRLVPIAAGYTGVRRELVEKQRNIAKTNLESGKIVVVEGRDIATIVLPDADFKLFLTASPQERARRRKAQLEEKGTDQDLESVLNDVNERDRKDIEINHVLVKDPLEHGYSILDNSKLSQEETLEEVLRLIKEKGLYDSL